MFVDELAMELIDRFQWNSDDVRVVTEFVTTLHRDGSLGEDKAFKVLAYASHLINNADYEMDYDAVVGRRQEKTRYQEKLKTMQRKELLGPTANLTHPES